MTEKEKLEARERRIRRQLCILREQGLPTLRKPIREKLVKQLMRLRGDPPALPDLRVIYRYAARGFLDAELSEVNNVD